MKFKLIHVETCLPDYWGGHHLPHIAIMAYPMTFKQCKIYLKGEIDLDCIMGEYHGTDEEYKAMLEAIDSLELRDNKPDDTIVFAEFINHDDDEGMDCSQAYFVFKQIEE